MRRSSHARRPADVGVLATRLNSICSRHGWSWRTIRQGHRVHITVYGQGGDPVYSAISGSEADVIESAINDIA